MGYTHGIRIPNQKKRLDECSGPFKQKNKMGNQRALWMVGLEYPGECFFFWGGGRLV